MAGGPQAPNQYESVTMPPRLPLVVQTANRDGTFTKDARLVNCYLETDEQGEVWVYKRAGIAPFLSLGAKPGYGVFYWEGSTYSIFEDKFYKNGVLFHTGLDTTNGLYWFSSIKGAVPKLVFGNGKKTYAYTDAGVTVTSLTTSAAGGTIAAGTYYYVVTAITPQGETVRSSEFSVVTTGATSSNTINWDTFATATGYRIYKGTAAGVETAYYSVGVVNTYVDTGTAGTVGTPPSVGILSNDLHSIDTNFPAQTVKGIVYLNGATYVMQSAAKIWGSVINSVSVPGDWSAIDFIEAQIEPDNGVALQKQLVYVIAFGEWSTEVFFDAGNPVGSPLGPVQGSKISYGCEHADSVQRIDDMLFWLSTSQTAAVQISMLSQLTHTVISTKPIDRLLQASDLTSIFSWQLKIDGHNFYVITVKNANLTLAYDISEGQWFQWTDTDGNYMPIVASTYDTQNRHILQHESNGKLYYASMLNYNDDGMKIFVDIYTPIFDATTARRKQLAMMRFVGDQDRGSLLHVRYSDNDYKSWSNFRTVKLDAKKPTLINCGTFTRRAYHLRHWSDTPLRLQAIDVQYDVGTL